MINSVKTITVAAALLAAVTLTSKAQTVGFLDVNPDPVALSMGGTGTTLEATP